MFYIDCKQDVFNLKNIKEITFLNVITDVSNNVFIILSDTLTHRIENRHFSNYKFIGK